MSSKLHHPPREPRATARDVNRQAPGVFLIKVVSKLHLTFLLNADSRFYRVHHLQFTAHATATRRLETKIARNLERRGLQCSSSHLADYESESCMDESTAFDCELVAVAMCANSIGAVITDIIHKKISLKGISALGSAKAVPYGHHCIRATDSGVNFLSSPQISHFDGDMSIPSGRSSPSDQRLCSPRVGNDRKLLPLHLFVWHVRVWREHLCGLASTLWNYYRLFCLGSRPAAKLNPYVRFGKHGRSIRLLVQN